jgi:hypothetical protein
MNEILRQFLQTIFTLIFVIGLIAIIENLIYKKPLSILINKFAEWLSEKLSR